MKIGKVIFLSFLVLMCTPLIADAQSISHSITVHGQIGETIKQEEVSKDKEKEEDKKQIIVADVSQISQGKLPQTGSQKTASFMLLGFLLLGIWFLLHSKKRKNHI